MKIATLTLAALAALIAVGCQTSRAGSPDMFAAAARKQGVPVALAHAVIRVESGGRCNAVGPATRAGRGMGPLQILPSSARGLGYRGPVSALATCGAGLTYGMKHLAMCWHMTGNVQQAARCHVGGPGAIHNRSRYVNGYVRSVQRGG